MIFYPSRKPEAFHNTRFTELFGLIPSFLVEKSVIPSFPESPSPIPLINIQNHFETFDLMVNQSGKVHLRKIIQNRVTGEVKKQLENKKQPANVKTDTDTILNFSNPLLAKWITSLYDFSKNKADFMNGWERSTDLPSRILGFFQIDEVLKCKDIFTPIKFNLSTRFFSYGKDSPAFSTILF